MIDEVQDATRNVLSIAGRWRAESSIAPSGGDIYVVVFSLLVVGAGLISALVSIAGDIGCVLAGCAQAPRPLLLGLLPVAMMAIALLAGRMLGPLFASRGELAILFRAPLSRRVLLSRTRRGVMVVAAGCGAVVAAVLALWYGQSVLLGLPSLIAALAGISMSERWQLRGRQVRTDPYFYGSAAIGLASAAVAVWWLSPPVPGDLLPAIVLVILAVCCVVVLRFCGRDLDAISILTLSSADDLRNGLQGAALSMDAGLVVDILQGRSRSASGSGLAVLRGTGLPAIVFAEVWRTVKCERRSAAAGMLAIMAGLASIVPGSRSEYIVAVILVMIGAVLQVGGLRRVLTSAGLRRVFPESMPRLRLAFAAPGIMVAAAWTLVVTASAVAGLLPVNLPATIACLWLGLAGAVRWTAVGSPDFSVGLLSTDLGVIPVGALLSSVRGWDIALIGGMALSVGGLWGLPVCAACIGFGLLHG